VEPGTKLGAFEIKGLLGKGGMGEVYRATDSKLGRQVAIKVLPETFAREPERLARFEREARVLATLDHPNIGALYDFQQSGEIRYLVMQLVEGETLADRIDSGPIPLEEILVLFSQIALGLEAAHEKGVIHRDLKPANIIITSEGQAKVLDFGMAASEESVSGISSPTDVTKPSDTPPQSKLTTDGAILGTPAYMAPEQARGKKIDKRVDIWAFGCCLYEALTGRMPFEEETLSDTIASVLKQEVDFDLLPKDTPWRIRELIESCLEKDVRHRLRDIGDAWSELRKLSTDSGRMTPEASVTEAPIRRGKLPLVAAISVSLIFGALTAWFLIPILNPPASTDSTSPLGEMLAATQEPNPVNRFEIDIGHLQGGLILKGTTAEIAISPDGRRLAYVARVDNEQKIYVRHLDQITPVALAGTEGAYNPFFSPDGEWIGYQTMKREDGTAKLMKVSVSGGTPQRIADAYPPAGAVWLEDDTIVYTAQDDDLPDVGSSYLSRLYRVRATGGNPERLTNVEGFSTDEYSHYEPDAVIGSNSVLFAVTRFEGRAVALVNLETKEHEVIIENARHPQYVTSGHILFSRDGKLWAVPFDVDTLSISGAETPVQTDGQAELDGGIVDYAVSRDGSLFYVPVEKEPEELRTLVWVDHNGQEESIKLGNRQFHSPKVSPDGTRVVFPMGDVDNRDLWIHDLSIESSLNRLTFAPEPDGNPQWSDDSQFIYFGSPRDNEVNDLYRKRADGSGQVELVLGGDIDLRPVAMTSDSKTAFYHTKTEDTARDISTVSLEGDPNEHLLIHTELHEGTPHLSPDGKWMVYTARIPSTFVASIWVRPYPNVDDGRWEISNTSFGAQPRWSPDGTEIYYRSGDHMMAIKVRTEPSFVAETPRVLFEDIYYTTGDALIQYDLEYPEGKRFLMMKEIEDISNTKLVYVENWSSTLSRTAPPEPK
jgi:serine/threonine-protein kinase